MLDTPPPSREPPLSQFAADTDGQLLRDLTCSRHILQQPMMDSLTTVSQYDSLASVDLMTHQPTTAFESSLADSEMVAAGADMGVSDFAFSSLDVHMSEDSMVMPDILSTLSTDISNLLY